jgi:hypothetical protein
MPNLRKGDTTHHCPKASKGNCRTGKVNGSKYCAAHNVVCRLHNEVLLPNQSCRGCANTRKAEAKEAAKQKQENDDSTDKNTEKGSKGKNTRKKTTDYRM